VTHDVRALQNLSQVHGEARLPYSTLVVCAHPDDEVIGVGALLPHLRDVSVLHITDGAPRDVRFRPANLEISREAYASERHAEAVSALALAGIASERIESIGVSDQEASFGLVALVRDLRTRLERHAPDLIIVQPYEGGHPDHDAAAFAVHTALALLPRRGVLSPTLVEMSSYHGLAGTRVTGEFVSNPTCASVTRVLSPLERARKRDMLACFATQQAVLQGFGVEVERYRAAPHYDFTQPPHEGPLLYEQLGWPLTGERWRALAREALREFRL
jgi:LmbE family N-acetylglucosaminyl deacetylase